MWKIWLVMIALFALGTAPRFVPAVLDFHCVEAINPKPGNSVRIEQQQTNVTHEDGTEFLPVLFGFRLKTTDTLLALFTLGLWISTWQLWKAGERQAGFTQQQLQLARDQFNYVNRPRITVRRARVRFESTGNGINFVLVNLGHLPATNIECIINVRIVANNDVAEFLKESAPRYEPVKPIKHTELGGNQRTFMYVISDRVNDSSMKSVDEHNNALFFYGIISFVGPDNVGRTSAFFGKYRPLTKRFGRMKDRDYDYY